ncbi:MAG: hypothetical protein IJI23_00280 [Lachnospiraceae bacterium]|nr:hypothetical protein [Lachnospiraceae bacterium]
MREKLFEMIDAAIENELTAAKNKYPTNNSRHESYAVLLEEWEETKEILPQLDYFIHMSWVMTKRNKPTDEILKALAAGKALCRNLIAEAIQTAAMFDKFMEYVETEKCTKPAEKCTNPAKKNTKKEKSDQKELKPRVVKLETVKIPRERSLKQQAAIDAIKDAYTKKRAEKVANKIEKPENKRGRVRIDIDNSLIVYMIDQQNRRFKDIAKELGCCEQTVRNRYEKGKREEKKQ